MQPHDISLHLKSPAWTNAQRLIHQLPAKETGKMGFAFSQLQGSTLWMHACDCVLYMRSTTWSNKWCWRGLLAVIFLAASNLTTSLCHIMPCILKQARPNANQICGARPWLQFLGALEDLPAAVQWKHENYFGLMNLLLLLRDFTLAQCRLWTHRLVTVQNNHFALQLTHHWCTCSGAQVVEAWLWSNNSPW